jgi:hypothetical protein
MRSIRSASHIVRPSPRTPLTSQNPSVFGKHTEIRTAYSRILLLERAASESSHADPKICE